MSRGQGGRVTGGVAGGATFIPETAAAAQVAFVGQDLGGVQVGEDVGPLRFRNHGARRGVCGHLREHGRGVVPQGAHESARSGDVAAASAEIGSGVGAFARD